MIPAPLAQATRVFKAPADWDAEKNGPCGDLQIVDINGFMVSAWRPTREELVALTKGKPVLLAIAGSVHPVVSLGVDM